MQLSGQYLVIQMDNGMNPLQLQEVKAFGEDIAAIFPGVCVCVCVSYFEHGIQTILVMTL